MAPSFTVGRFVICTGFVRKFRLNEISDGLIIALTTRWISIGFIVLNCFASFSQVYEQCKGLWRKR